MRGIKAILTGLFSSAVGTTLDASNMVFSLSDPASQYLALDIDSELAACACCVKTPDKFLAQSNPFRHPMKLNVPVM